METRTAPFGSSAPAKKKRFPVGWVLFAVVLLLGGAGFWYYFFGKKPRVVLTVALPAAAGEYSSESNLWPLDNGEVLVLAGRELKLVSLLDREVKWTAKVPAAPPVDPEARAAVNSRFVRLQQWADELTRKRAALKTPQETKAFNEEAAKYQAELVAARAAATKSAAPDAPAPAPAAKAVAANKPVPPAPPVPKKPATEEEPSLKPIVTPEMQLIEARLKRRADQITKLSASIKTKKAKAKTEIQLSVVTDEERRLEKLNAEQKEEQEQLAQLKGTKKLPAKVEPEAEEEEPAEEEVAEFYVQAAGPFAAVAGSEVWLADEERLVAFDRGTGSVKSDVPLAGPILGAWAMGGEIFVVASAGVEARQISRIAAGAAPVSLFAPAAPVAKHLELAGAEARARIEPRRTDFTGRLLRADIQLVEKKIVPRSTIKGGSDEGAIDTINSSAAHSSDELSAVMKLVANDAKRLTGETLEFVDASTYEVTLSRPLDASTAPWKGEVAGRVELFSTGSLDLIAAGTKLLAFDAKNQKRWEATLGAPVPRREPDSEAPPVLEAGDRLYFADGAFLTAFETASGKVLWRVPSIGIRKLQLDGDGNVYAHSLNLPTEALSGTYDDLGEANTTTMKIDAGSGEILWKQEKYEGLWVNGGDIYALREGKRLEDIEEQVFSGKTQVRVKLFKLRSSSGEPIWEWFQPRRPSAVHAAGKTVGLMFDQELQVLHSIAW